MNSVYDELVERYELHSDMGGFGADVRQVGLSLTVPVPTKSKLRSSGPEWRGDLVWEEKIPKKGRG